MNNKQKILKSILHKYVNRKQWQSEIANEFSVSRHDISLLCIKAGYFRGKRVKTVPLTEVLEDPEVQNIINKLVQVA